jgi:multiple sugar transport system ATP-binding protein
MSTTIAVMKEGVLQQLDTPDRVYHYPANLFVADFIGNPKVNVMSGAVDRKNWVRVGDFHVAVDTASTMGEVVVAMRPEDIAISTTPMDEAVEFTAYSVLPSGADSTIVAHRGKTEVTVKVSGISKIKMDDKIWLKFQPECINLYHKATGNLVVT